MVQGYKSKPCIQKAPRHLPSHPGVAEHSAATSQATHCNQGSHGSTAPPAVRPAVAAARSLGFAAAGVPLQLVPIRTLRTHISVGSRHGSGDVLESPVLDAGRPPGLF
jgi:hypothetical protein